MSSSLSRGGGRARPRGAGGFELFSWYFFRVSGVALLLLAVFHVIIMHVINTVNEIDHAFVVERWSQPFWQVYDFLLLTLALLHGVNGARVAVDDYIRSNGWRVAAYSALLLIALVFMVLGGLALVTFDPGQFESVAGR
ncbi:MAG TPA: succinate dehydrogenase [Thermomicrobiales bacterium]|nr:succinate dehydrogenase [Thermomicrobiales bacterium]